MTAASVLIIDDDKATLLALPESVRNRLAGVSIDTCESPHMALTQIASIDYDAIVSDILMPEMDGLTLLARIKALRPHTPTLVITSHDRHDYAVEALRKGAYDFIQKPIDQEYFAASLDRAIRMRQLSRQLEEQRVALAQRAQELERSQEALRNQTRILQSVLDTAHDAFISIDGDSVILDWNPQAKLTFGWSREEVLGRSLPDTIIPHRYREAHWQGLRRFLETEQGPVLNRRLELAALHRSGREFPVELTIAPVRFGSGYRFNAFVHDITERKRSEQALAQRAEELARSNRDLEQFAYVASHDLQEPLRMVAGYVKLLAQRYRGKLDADAGEFIDYAVDGATRMQRLINDLLAYARLGNGGKPLQPTDCDAVLTEALSNLQAAIQETGAEVTHSTLPAVEADAGQLVLVFQNLLSNALKFRGPEPPRVHVEAVREEPMWRFSVQDNGIGIEPRYFERIFLIFSRLHGRAEYPGTGIGLAICKKIVQRHGGCIWLDSQPGRGATFYFTIPAAVGA
ncbi:MAG: ATP-binding protein [Pirellulales bacterium]